VWTTKENKPEGSVANSIISWVFVSIEKGLELVEVVVSIKKSSKQSVATDLLYDQPSQTMSDEYDFRRRCCLSGIIRIVIPMRDIIYLQRVALHI
jgi:hypothetical protein